MLEPIVSIINSLKIGNFKTNDPEEIANAFNDFYINIAENVKEPIETSSHESL